MTNGINHYVVLQLVKSKKMHTKLELVVETEKEKTQRKEFVFNDTKVKPHYECNGSDVICKCQQRIWIYLLL